MMKWPTIISLLANVALVVVWLRSGPAASPGNTTEDRIASAAVPKVELLTNTVTTIRVAQPDAPRFDWSLVEAEEYEAYMANLRRLELPEWLIREMILVDLQRHYRLQAAKEVKSGTAHWLTHREWRELQKRDAAAAWALKQKERAVMRQLVGVYRARTADELVKMGQIAIVFGALNEDQALEIVSEYFFVKEHADFLERYHNRFLSHADEAELLNAFTTAKAGLAGRISPQLIEEFYLRLQVVLGGMMDEMKMPGLQLTGAQLRELVRIRVGILDPLRWELTKESKPGNPELFQLNREVQAAVAAVLGEEIAAQYARSQDPAFRAVHDLAMRHELPVERAIVVHDIRQATIDETRSVVTSGGIDDWEKWEMRQFIQQEAERAVQSTLPPAAWEEYRADAGRWLDRVGGQPPDADTGGGR
jgi:hypothetical protein